MRTGLKFAQELLTGIDVMNTLNGGMSEPVVKLKQYPTYREIRVRVPGVDVENVRIEINNNDLMIYYFTVMLSQDQELRFPKILYNKSIPYFVDSKKITAAEQGGTLVVRLPFNELSGGHHRDISIKK